MPLLLTVLLGCGTGLYHSCDEATDCPPDDRDAAECLDKDNGAFCTWSCTTDDDCEAIHPAYICSSFEDEEGFYCFASCEEDGGEQQCGAGFTCRSTGGGAANRKVCFPE